MRHQNSGRKFNMAPDQRRALLSGLACQVLEHEKVMTGVVRAKEVRPLVEQVITLGKRGDLHARRQAISFSATRRSSTSSSTMWRRAIKSATAATRVS